MLENICKKCFCNKRTALICPECGFNGEIQTEKNVLQIGTVLNGKYLIGKVLGIGGFGITYLGYDLNLEIKVAIKEYLPNSLASRTYNGREITAHTDQSKQSFRLGLEKFLDEARAVAKFSQHQNVVSVRDFFPENKTAYMVMDYIQGKDLVEYIKEKQRPLYFNEAIELFNPIMDALVHVHKQGLLHRDISPDNIYITNDGIPMLLDFGAARQYTNDSQSMSVVLKFGYAPIEQYSQKGNQGAWTDIYAIAATFYHTITGRKPPESLERITKDEIVAPSQLGFVIPQKSETALIKALAINAEDRYCTVLDFYNAINDLDSSGEQYDTTEKAKNDEKNINGEYTLEKKHPKYQKLEKKEHPQKNRSSNSNNRKNIFGKVNNKSKEKLIKSVLVSIAVLIVMSVTIVGGLKLVQNNSDNINDVATIVQNKSDNINDVAPLVQSDSDNTNDVVPIVQSDSDNTNEAAPIVQNDSEDANSTVSALQNNFDIAMVTDAGYIDDKSYNESTWNGVWNFAQANDVSYKYYDPVENSHDGRLAAIDLAIKGGAEIVVCSGFLFETVIYDAQSRYPIVKFIILDGTPHNESYSDFTIERNVYSIFYAEQESSFLAGYAAVKDGYTDLGFMGGMAVPAVVRFGYGFVQGAEYAAEEMGIDGINIKYHYTGSFNDTPEAQTLAASWYADGTEVIFSVGGSVIFSVDAAAQATEDGKIIGVDVDQSYLSDRVITSAKKELAVSVFAALEDVYSDSFKGGTIDVFDIKINGVGLPIETSKFNRFSQADYDSIYATLAADSSFILDDTDVEAADAIPTEAVTVTVVE